MHKFDDGNDIQHRESPVERQQCGAAGRMGLYNKDRVHRRLASSSPARDTCCVVRQVQFEVKKFLSTLRHGQSAKFVT